MNYKQWGKVIKKYPHKDLNGTYIAYGSDGKPVGEVIYKEGKVISRKTYGREYGKRSIGSGGNPFRG